MTNGVSAPIGLANGAAPRPARGDALSEVRENAYRRCRLRGGTSTGPRTEAGLARLTAGWTTHGKYTNEKRAVARRYAEQGRQMRAELKELETWFTARLIAPFSGNL